MICRHGSTRFATSLPQKVTSAPAFRAAMLGSAFMGLPFVVCAAGKSTYDVLLFVFFRNVRTDH